MTEVGVCVLCDEDVEENDDYRPMGTPEGIGMAHRECTLRVVMGGIGHLEDHEYWCIQRGDPDGGRTFRESALEVDAWITLHGIP